MTYQPLRVDTNTTTRPDSVARPRTSVFRTLRPTEIRDADGLRTVPRAEVFGGGCLRGGTWRRRRRWRWGAPRAVVVTVPPPRPLCRAATMRAQRRGGGGGAVQEKRPASGTFGTGATDDDAPPPLAVPPRFSDTPHTHETSRTPSPSYRRASFARPRSPAADHVDESDRRAIVESTVFAACFRHVSTTPFQHWPLLFFIVTHVIHTDRWNCFGGAELVCYLFACTNGLEVPLRTTKIHVVLREN